MDKISKSEYDLKYYESNREKRRIQQKEYYERNKNKIADYYKINKKRISANKLIYHKKKRESDFTFRFIYNLRVRQKQVLKGISSTTKGLGCNNDELKIWMESKFTEGMSWDNYGNKEGCWSNDHIIPLSSYKKDANGDWVQFSQVETDQPQVESYNTQSQQSSREEDTNINEEP